VTAVRMDSAVAPRDQNARAEKAREIKERKAVARAIEAALKQIAQYDPELADTLRNEIKSGKVLSHVPGRK